MFFEAFQAQKASRVLFPVIPNMQRPQSTRYRWLTEPSKLVLETRTEWILPPITNTNPRPFQIVRRTQQEIDEEIKARFPGRDSLERTKTINHNLVGDILADLLLEEDIVKSPDNFIHALRYYENFLSQLNIQDRLLILEVLCNKCAPNADTTQARADCILYLENV